jgi:hypothetical protein
VDVVNHFYFKSLHLYINPISTFDDLVFDEFLKLLSHSHDVFPLSWCLHLIEPQGFLGFKIARLIYFIHTCSLANGSWIKVDQDAFKRLVVAMRNSCIDQAAQILISKL